MRSIIFIILFNVILFLQPAFSSEYSLKFEQECSYQNQGFSCAKYDETKTIREWPEGHWVGVNPGGGDGVELKVVKNDEYIMVFEVPVKFSGTSTISIMKKTGRFYWSEFAYSKILKTDEGYVRVGKMTMKFQK